MDTIRAGGLFAAATASVVAPVVAVSYLHTPEGLEYLSQGTIAAWAEPASALLRGWLDSLGAERLYLLASEVLAVLWSISVVVSVLAFRQRRPVRIERIWWLLTLSGYLWFTLGLLGFCAIAEALGVAHPAANLAFLVFMAPGLLISLIGSTGLGVVLLRRGGRARASAWLLTAAVPLWLVANLVLGHNSLGLLPIMWAWGLTPRPGPAHSR